MSRQPYEVRLPLSRLEFEFLERARQASGTSALFYEWCRVTLMVHAARVLDGVEVPPPKALSKPRE